MAGSYDIVGAFPDGSHARSALERLERHGLDRARVHLVRRGENDATRVGALRAEMRDEAANAVAGPSIGLMTAGQAKGAFTGTAVAGAIGLLLGLAIGAIWAFAGESAISPIGRLVICAAAFAVGGLTIGFVVGGSAKPRMDSASQPNRRMDEPPMAGEHDALVTVTVTGDREAGTVERVLSEAGATRVDKLDAEGSPMPHQADHPRPADPPDRWTNGSRGGG